MRQDRWTIGVAVFFVVAAIATLAVWIPNDIESGLVEKLRRQIIIGDALAPTCVAAGILITAALMGVFALFRPEPLGDAPDLQSLSFLLRMAVAIVPGLVIMVYAGPLAVELMNAIGFDIGSYRELRDTVPYKYIGYGIGGFVMVFGVIRVVENRLSASAIWVSILAVVVLAVLYDVPFDDLLLPPNGDQ